LKKTLRVLLRAAISIALVAYVFSLIDFNDALNQVQAVDLTWLAAAVLTFVASLLLFAARWMVLLKVDHHIDVSYWRLLRYYWVGLFFNNFLPTSIGGDFVRALYLSGDNNSRSSSLASVFLERLLGFLVTTFISFAALFLFIDELPSNTLWVLGFMLLALLMFFVLFVFHNGFYRWSTGILGRIHFFRLGERFTKVFSFLHNYRGQPDILFSAFMFSAAGQFLIILFNYFVFLGIYHDSFSFYPFLIIIPITIVVSLFPSINGLGTRESAYVWLFGLFNVASETSFALAVLIFILPLVISLSGGLLYITDNFSIKKALLKETSV
jgi:uncharacterized protein (TIRG00374 family)